MLNEKITSLMNEQINKEFYSAYLYLNFANFYEAKGLTGFSSWFRIQAKEEEGHGMLFYDLNDDLKIVFHSPNSPAGDERALILKLTEKDGMLSSC